jgi:hypothetical protein
MASAADMQSMLKKAVMENPDIPADMKQQVLNQSEQFINQNGGWSNMENIGERIEQSGGNIPLIWALKELLKRSLYLKQVRPPLPQFHGFRRKAMEKCRIPANTATIMNEG